MGGRVSTLALILEGEIQLISFGWKKFEPSALSLERNFWNLNGVGVVEITSLPEIKKVIYIYGTSFQSSPKINCMLITSTICIQWKFTTPDHRSFAN